MKIYFLRFNTVLILLLPVLLVAGCATKKDVSTLRVHLETSAKAPNERTIPVEMFRENSFTIYIDSQPFLDEGHVAKASVVKSMGNHQIMIEFNRQGTWILEQYTTAARGQRMAIFSQFGKGKEVQKRWLAAPKFDRTIKDGVLVFTPDASVEESEQIVRGLNEVAKTAQKNNP